MEEIERIVKQKERILRDVEDDIFNIVYAITLADVERPAWCLLPLDTSLKLLLDYAEVKNEKQALGAIAYANLLSCIGSWRLSKDIIRLDDTLFDALADTEFSGKLPTEVFMRMPSFCTYVEMETEDFIGFFFALEKSKGDSDPELRIWWDEKDGNFILTPVHLGNWTVEESMDRAEKYIKAVTTGNEELRAMGKLEDRHLGKALNIILYLCAQNSEYSRSESRPSKPYPKKTKRGFRFFEADRPNIWKVGEATGEQIRAQREAATRSTGYSVRPHLRRAHWHGFWSGPKNAEKRKFDVKWLPPIFVASD